MTSIRESDIEKQFQGKESAYMLFYRKTQLHRPSEGNEYHIVMERLYPLSSTREGNRGEVKLEFRGFLLI